MTRELNYTLYKAIHAHYEGERTKALYQLDLAFQKPVAIGEHPQHVDEADKLIEKIAAAEEKLRVLQEYKL